MYVRDIVRFHSGVEEVLLDGCSLKVDDASSKSFRLLYYTADL